jgi:hypothetical protein
VALSVEGTKWVAPERDFTESIHPSVAILASWVGLGQALEMVMALRKQLPCVIKRYSSSVTLAAGLPTVAAVCGPCVAGWSFIRSTKGVALEELQLFQNNTQKHSCIHSSSVRPLA